jgi:cytochrome P450 family 135
MSAQTKTMPPGPNWPAPISTLGWWSRPNPLVRRMRNRYGDTFSFPILHEGRWVFISDPEDVKTVFTAPAKAAHAGEANAILKPILGGNSVLLLDEAAHMRQRKLLLPPLHGERMQSYGELMAEIAQAEIASWPAGEPMQLWPRMQAITLEVIMRAVFGIRDAARLDELRRMLPQILAWTSSGQQMLLLMVFGPEKATEAPHVKRALAPIDAVLIDEIQRRRAESDLEEREDILSMLVQARHEDGSPMSDVELRDELMTLLVAGHETTATALSWAAERLVRHPEKLERLRAEVEAGEEDYLDAVVKETLRIRPVLPIVLRLLKEPMTLGGYDLQPGTYVAPSIYLVHHREDIYPEPDRFLPERFLETPAGTYTWFPFGGGIRRCLGAAFALFEMKAVLRALVSSVELRATEPQNERTARRVIVHTPARGASVVVRPLDRSGAGERETVAAAA